MMWVGWRLLQAFRPSVSIVSKPNHPQSGRRADSAAGNSLVPSSVHVHADVLRWNYSSAKT